MTLHMMYWNSSPIPKLNWLKTMITTMKQMSPLQDRLPICYPFWIIMIQNHFQCHPRTVLIKIQLDLSLFLFQN